MPLPKNLPEDFQSSGAQQDRVLIAKRYRLDKKLGSGNFGVAFLIFDETIKPPNENRKVLKQICVGKIDPGETVEAMHEAKLLKRLQHDNIVQFHDSFLNGEYFCIVTEFCDGGELADKLKEYKRKKKLVDESQVLKWFEQLLKAIQYMHQRRVLHRDLKTQNIFLRGNNVKIGDFGISRMLLGTSDMANTFAGTPYYMSPEMLNCNSYDEKCDIWSLGCVMYEICNLEVAFTGPNLMAILHKITSDYRPKLHDQYSRGLSNILESMLASKPEKRQTAKEILDRLVLITSTRKNSENDLTPKEQLRLRKQKNADEMFKMHKELAEMNFKENEKRHKESTEKHFHRTSIESHTSDRRKESKRDLKNKQQSSVKQVSSIKQSEVASKLNEYDQQSANTQKKGHTFHANAAKYLQGSDTKSALTLPFSMPSYLDEKDESDDENNATLLGTSADVPIVESTQDLILSLIKNGDIPEDPEIANTLYGEYYDFDMDSDSDSFGDFENDLGLSDLEYREMMGCMEEALDLQDTVKEITQYRDDSENPQGLRKDNHPTTLAENLMDNQIKNLRKKCSELLGERTFNEAYSYLRKVWSNHIVPEVSNYESVVVHLTEIVPDKNKCFLLEQLVYLENDRARQ